jgi:hypothetical protein
MKLLGQCLALKAKPGTRSATELEKIAKVSITFVAPPLCSLLFAPPP